MSNTSNNSLNSNVEQQVQEAVLKRIASGVQSAAVDGMSTSYQNPETLVKALFAIQKQQASKNPLAAIKLFKIKSGN